MQNPGSSEVRSCHREGKAGSQNLTDCAITQCLEVAAEEWDATAEGWADIEEKLHRYLLH